MATYNDFFTGVLQQLGAPVTKPNLDFLAGWAQVEGTAAKNNPLATTLRTSDSTPLPGNSAGVQQYATAGEGQSATAQTLQGYPSIVAALRTGNILGVSFGNPPALVSDFSRWSGNAKNPAAGFAYFQKVKVRAQGGSGGLSAADIGSYDLGNAAHDVGSATGITSVADFLKRLTDPAYILRGLQIVAGGVLVLVGVYLLAKQVGLAAPSLPDALSPAARAAEAASLEKAQTRERRSSERHAAALAESEARVKTQRARATELRTRTRHRKRAKDEQNREVERAYIRGAAETSPLGG